MPDVIIDSLLATPSPWLVILVLSVVSLATVKDFISHKIPNSLTVTAALIGFFLQGYGNGLAGLGDALIALVLVFAALLPFYVARWISAGDIKLLMAVGVCLGWRLGLLCVLSTLMIGAIVAFVYLILTGGILPFLQRYLVMAKCLLATGRFAYIPPEPFEPASVRIPYAFAIALGTLAAIYGPAHWSFMRIPILSGG